ncbi:kinase-like domain-containing protein [Lipomyces japonicus]|uniref:kinase-like domain-containing protein n=1 Tax=Lipomyces japonicus TaxID=56871 RepID=UPI0034CE86AD
MAAVFAFDEPDIDSDFPFLSRTRSVSSVDSRDDFWIPPSYNGAAVDSSQKIVGGFGVIAEDVEDFEYNSAGQAVPMVIADNDINQLGSALKNLQFKDEDKMATSYKVELVGDFVAEDFKTQKRLIPADFEPIKVLGQGAYGKVLLVREKSTGRLFAQKQLKKASMTVHKKTAEQTKTERSILESVRHPFIVKLFYALQDPHKLYLILEYAQGGELFSHLASEKMLSEEVVTFYTAELVLALQHLHGTVGVVYRDLKPENCLLDAQGHLVLTDFGLSKVANDGGSCKTFLGTPEYMAPEILLGKPYDFAVDWWSLGALAYDLLTGSPPFTGNNFKRIIEKIQKTKLVLPYYLTAEAKDLLTRLLRKEPKKRLGNNLPNDFDIIRKHRFFRKINWKKLESRDPSLVPPILPVITDPILAENFLESFTSMAISPPGVEIQGIPSSDNIDEALTFENFTFTASNSFIESAMSSIAV